MSSLPNSVRRPSAIGTGGPTEQTAKVLVDQVLEAAARARASDIHIDPGDGQVIIRMRVDGRLRQWNQIPTELALQALSRLKVLAHMDISDKRRPQDGRFTIETKDGMRDYRIATAPMLEGEKAVIRCLQHDVSALSIKSIGYSEANLQHYHELLKNPHGLILHCGPTGSGKTSALYAAINHLSKSWRNIQTIEDPVEGRIPGINQAQVNSDIDLTFASLLRSYLRQDCDVILVGEIRDTETAQLAVQASMTGHLVLGTLHTNSAAGAVSRLTEMGIPAFLISTALMGAVSQRLVRRLCTACKHSYEPGPQVVSQCKLAPQQVLYKADGCEHCGNTGYKGRLGIQEVFIVNPNIRDAMRKQSTETELQRLGFRAGMTNIFTDGVAKAVAGHTTIEEVYNSVAAG